MRLHWTCLRGWLYLSQNSATIYTWSPGVQVRIVWVFKINMWNLNLHHLTKQQEISGIGRHANLTSVHIHGCRSIWEAENECKVGNNPRIIWIWKGPIRTDQLLNSVHLDSPIGRVEWPPVERHPSCEVPCHALFACSVHQQYPGLLNVAAEASTVPPNPTYTSAATLWGATGSQLVLVLLVAPLALETCLDCCISLLHCRMCYARVAVLGKWPNK